MLKKEGVLNWLLLIVLSLIWGSSYILIKRSVAGFQPLQVGALRMLISGIALSPFLVRAGRHFSKKDILPLLAVCIIGSGLPTVLYPLAQQKLDSGVTGIINSLTPLFTFLMGVIFFNTVFRLPKMVGVLLGLLGAIALIVLQPGEATYRADALYAGYAVLATICYGFSSNLLKSHLGNKPPLKLTAVMYMLLAIPSAIYVFNSGTASYIIESPEARISLLYVAVLALFGTALAMVLFNMLIQRTNALFAATVTYMMPLVAILFGVFDGEVFGYHHIIGLVLILIGVYLTNRKQKGAKPPPQSPISRV